MARTSASTSASASPRTAPAGSDPPRRLGVVTTTALVAASMVGTGVFTTTGFLVGPIGSARGILWCWAVGGLAALSGALTYAELATATPESGGEYRFLRRWIHPTVGFVAAFVSLIVGFAAPLAALALAFGDYLNAVWPVGPPALTGGALVVALSALNAWRVSAGSGVHNLFTALKIALIAALAGYGLVRGDPALIDRGAPALERVATPGFAVGLILVSFAYTGWNAAAYVAGEVKDPARTLPRALLVGTLVVTLLYVALNASFLMAVPMEALGGEGATVAHRAAVAVFGDGGGRVVAAIVAIGLVSTIGALVVTGPRIYEAVGRDLPGLGVLTRRSARGGPVYAVALQAGLALVMLVSASFEELLTYIGFTLSLFAGLTVACVFRLRASGVVAPFRTPGYPFTPAAFVLLTLWMVISGIVEKPGAALAGLATLGAGAAVHLVVSRQARG